MGAQRVEHEHRCDAAAAEISRFAAAVRDADPAATVPTCPGWSVADLVLHLGRVHRWAGGLVAGLAPRRLQARDLGVKFPSDASDPASYLPWFEDGGAELLATLRAADPGAPMWSFGSDQHVRFWPRRMLHETAIHRCDAEFAIGREPVIDEDTAVDGIDELLEILRGSSVFAPPVEKLRGTGETIALTTTATTGIAAGTAARWLIRLEPDRFSWERDAPETSATASVRGAVSDVVLFLWGRRKLGDPRLEFAGDDALLIHWVENSAI